MRDEAMMQIEALNARVEALNARIEVLERARRVDTRAARLIAKFVLWMFKHPVNNQPEQVAMSSEARDLLESLG